MNSIDKIYVFAIRWRGMNKAEKQKYVDASEEDKKRYKKEVCEMSQKAKPVKSNAKKKLLKNVQNFEKAITDMTQTTTDTQNHTALITKKEVKKQPSNVGNKDKVPKYESSFRLSRTGSRQNSFTVTNSAIREKIDYITEGLDP